MLFPTWQQNFSSSRRLHKPRTGVPRLESLESRCLLSVNVMVSGMAVTIRATSGEDLVIDNDGTNLTYKVDGTVNTLVDINASDIESLSINCNSASPAASNQVDLNLDEMVFSMLTTVRVATGGGSDTVNAQGSDFAVSISGGLESDLIVGSNSSGADTLVGGNGDDTLLGLDGNDVLVGGAGNDVLLGGEGSDQLFGGLTVPLTATAASGTGNDVLSGEGGADTCSGGDGNDSISGGAGDDIVNGNAGNDSLTGDAGNDSVYGGTGRDTVFGGTGLDVLKGQGGVDRIEGTRAAAQTEINALNQMFPLSEGRLRRLASLEADALSEFVGQLPFNANFVPDENGFLDLL